MFITKKHLSRRTFLRGAGVAVGLPLLDAMIPAATALSQTAATPTPRMGFIYFPHGAIMDRWTPATEGTDFELSPILKPLEPFKKQLTIVSGLENNAAIAPPVHALSPGTWLSGVAPRKTQDPWGGVTIDQMAAQHLGQDTPFPSLEVGIEARGGGGACDREYGCSYSGTISFRTPSTPLPMETDPRKLFQRLFGQGDTPQERKNIAQTVFEPSRPRFRRSRRSSEQSRRPRPGRAGRLSGERSRNRTARPEDGSARSLEAEAARCACRAAGAVRCAYQSDVRYGVAGVSGQPDARLHIHDGGGSQRPDLQPDRRAGCVPSDVASPERQDENRKAGEDPDLPHRDHGEIRRQARSACRTATATCWITRSCSTAAT